MGRTKNGKKRKSSLKREWKRSGKGNKSRKRDNDFPEGEQTPGDIEAHEGEIKWVCQPSPKLTG